jgi:hypothetical protein
MAFTLEENTYNGMTTLQLRIKDLIFEWHDIESREFIEKI